MRISAAFLLLVLAAGALLVAGRDGPNLPSEGLFVHEILAQPVGTCTSAGSDSGVYKLTGYKLPSTTMTYKTKQASFPAYLNVAEVQAAINTAFGTWDSATSRALFANGGTTTAKPATKDKVNTVAFASLPGGVVGLAYGWINSRTKTIIEFDISLSSNYTWALNGNATGDCGGGSGAFDVRNIATHEVGHPVGLDDLSSSSEHAQTMYGYVAYQELFKRDLASGDVAGVRALYGP